MPVRMPVVDPSTERLYDGEIPTSIARVDAVTAQIAAAIAGVEASTSIMAAVNALLLNTPMDHLAVGGAYPGRPVTERPVHWRTPEVLPPAPGSTTSGTGPVLGRDLVALAPGVGAPTG